MHWVVPKVRFIYSSCIGVQKDPFTLLNVKTRSFTEIRH